MAVGSRLKSDGRSITGSMDRKLRSLLGNEYNPDDWRGKRQTPLNLAVRSGTTETAAVLLARVADANSRSGAIISPLRIAIASGNTEMANLLVMSSADVNENVAWRQITVATLRVRTTPLTW